MALRLSTSLRNKMVGLRAAVTAITAGVGDGTPTFATGSPSTVTRSTGSWITDGFVGGDQLFVFQPTSPGNKSGIDGTLVALVEALTLTLDDAVVSDGEAFAAATVLCAAKGGSLKDVFQNGVLKVYSGSQPSDPDNAVAGSLLIEMTVASGAFSYGAEAAGLEFGDPTDGYIEKCADEVWSGLGLAAGTAAWFRLTANPNDDGSLDAGVIYPRMDGTVGTSGADATISNTQIVVDAPYTIDTFKLTYPMQYGA